jgi:hypothetical protein
MDASERLAEKYLQGLGLGAVVYEPDGNVPPDFSVGSRIAVEVRRLNQNYTDSSGTSRGLEEVTIPLWQRMKNILRSIGPSVDGECWYVGVDYRRPFPDWKQLDPRIRSQLGAFMQHPIRSRTTIQIAPNFNLDLLRAGMDHGLFFVLGASSDNDSGGWVMSEVERNLRLCIAQKEKKVAPYRAKYEEWWLVLADHIDYSMGEEDRVVFRTQVMPTIPHSFARIVFLDPRDNGRAFEV